MTADRGPDVMGSREVADALGITPQRVAQLDAAGRLPPSTELARGKVWDGPAIRAFAKDRGRPDLRHTKILQSYRKTGSVTRAATAAGVARSTAHRVLRDVGLI